MAVSGRFVSGASGRILLVSHEPGTAARGSVVVFPALAEEMNKSRRLVWSLGQRLALAGLLTVVPDLYGTGDSEGDFHDATWDTWQGDMHAAVAWARQQAPGPCHALIVRFGACLYGACTGLFDEDGRAHRVAAWQPEMSGAKALRQLLRMKVMADRVTWGRSTKLEQLREQLGDDSQPTEVGGYAYSAHLASAIDAASFDWAMMPQAASACLFDWSRPAPAAADDASEAAVARVQIEGQKFWSAVEPQHHAELVEETAAFLAAGT